MSGNEEGLLSQKGDMPEPRSTMHSIYNKGVANMRGPNDDFNW